MRTVSSPLKDRSKDLIISGGSNIYPREVEEVLLRHESVSGSLRYRAGPTRIGGEEVMAFVVLQDGKRVREEELDGLCLEHIARFKRPRSYRFHRGLAEEQLRKSFSRTALREMAERESRESEG